jgi:DNA repair exonuclease SbcCD nuclease subunit
VGLLQGYSMTNLFKKAIVFTDIHLGLKSNSILHNEDCLSFVKWATELARQEGCETCFFLGDWHNHRASINIVTLNYSLQALEHLNNNFNQVYFIPGNHDLYYRDRREVHGVAWARHLPNVVICNDWFQSGDVVIAPWLVGDDHRRIAKLKGRYMFGHFELPGYLMNAMIAMPDHGELRSDHFTNFEHVYTGHFHRRQTKKNITYIGNCFPHNYSDVNDDQRGCMILPWGEQPQYHAWPDQPTYRIMGLSDLLDRADKLLQPNMNVKVTLDIAISYEEANFIKETFVQQYKLREMSLIPNKTANVDQDIAPGDVKFESVDQIVVDQITKIDSEFYDTNLLLKIYQNL